MRKIRVNIFDDDKSNLELLRDFLEMRDYEVLTFDSPVGCPVYQEHGTECKNLKPCADIILTDYQMPRMTGIEMLSSQARNGCRIDPRNKAVMSGDPYSIKQEDLEALGCAFFNKPFQFEKLFAWLDECEQRIDLVRPVGIMRKEERYPADIDILYSSDSSKEICRGSVVNYGASGLCFIANSPCVEEQSITIKNELPNGCTNASVRWVKPQGDDSYMAGLMAQ